MRHRIWIETEAVADLGHETQPIDDLGEAMVLFFADTVNDDVRLAGKPESGGLPRSVPQGLFGYMQCFLNEVEKRDTHNRLLDLIFSYLLRSDTAAFFHFQ